MSDEERRTTEAADPDAGGDGAAPHPETPDAEAVIDAFGGIRPMANQLGVAVSTVQGWKSRNHIPENRWRDVIAAAAAAEVDLSRLTGGATEAPEGDQAQPEETPAESPWEPSSDGDDSRSESSDADPVAEPDDRPAEATPAAAAESATAPPPKSSPKTSSASAPAAAQATGGGGPAWLALLIGFIAVVGVATEPYWRPQAAAVLDPLIGKVAAVPQTSGQGVDPARIEALAREIAELSGRVEQVAARAQEALEGAGADGAGGDPAALAALQERVAALEEAPAGSGGLTPAALEEATAGLESRLGEIEAALASGPGAEAMQALRDRVAAMESRVAEQAQTIERVAEAPALKGAQQAAVVIAVGSVQDALAAGRPFEAPLERAAGLAPGDEALSQAIAALEPYAAQGVATRADLQRRFQASAAEMHAAVGGEGDWVDEAVGRLTSLVSVRQTGEGAERPPVSRAEAALARGDLSAAVAALSEIREASPAAARWLEAANARLDAEAAVERLRQAAVDRLTAGTEG